MPESAWIVFFSSKKKVKKKVTIITFKIKATFLPEKNIFKDNPGKIKIKPKLHRGMKTIFCLPKIVYSKTAKKKKKHRVFHNRALCPSCLLLAGIEWDHEILTNFIPPQVTWVIHFQSNAQFRATDGGRDGEQRKEQGGGVADAF